MTRKGRIVLAVILVLVLATSALAAVLLKQSVRRSELEELRNSALEELERNIGTYDEQSIVLNQTSKANAEELADLFGAKLRITEDGRFATLTLPEGVTIRDVYADEENLEHLEKMAVDYQVRISDADGAGDSDERLPTRPQYTVSDTDYELQTYLDYLNMQDVWSSCNGAGVTVAVIDTGIDTDHPEFAGRISEYSYNATEDKIVKDWADENGNYDWSLVEDEVGHGTAVAGVIAASMNSGNVVGIAPYTEILVIKAECDANGTFYRTSDLVFGLYYAIERDVQVVNMSFGTYSPVNPFAEAAQLAVDSDIVCVAAAGNDGTTSLCWPAADPNVIGVGALEADGWELAPYSNYGDNLDLVAPGTTYTALIHGAYGNMNGTSLASPVVAGGLALLMQNTPYTTVKDVTEVLYASCRDLGDPGEDWTYGFGALDLHALLLEERNTVTFEMLTDELENEEALFIRGHTLQQLPEPERLYAVFDGWYYDDTFTQEYVYYEDQFYDDITLYAKWANEEDGVPFTYVELEDGTIEIRSYTGRRRYITIPEKINGKIVSSIGEFAFAGQTRLREVGLPAGLTTIKRYAFEGCSNLLSIYIPENVVTIGEFAFTENIRLSTVAFTGQSKLKTVGIFAFSHCGSLRSIELPASLEGINATAFYGDLSLYEIKVQTGNALFVSDGGVLYNTTQSVLAAYPAAHGNSYTVHENTKTIADYAFAFARLTDVELGSVEAIGSYGFEGALLQELVIPDSVASLGKGAFAANRDLGSVTLGNELTAVAPCCFNSCSSLREITIPAGIGYIGSGAFAQSGLEKIVFAENSTLSLIDQNAFATCSLREIEFPDSVAEIGTEAFIETPLAKVTFGENSSLRVIGGSAFRGCVLLEEIRLPGRLESVGKLAFAETALREVTVPASVSVLGNGAFAFCPLLTAVHVEEGNTVYHDLDGVVYDLSDRMIHTYPAGRTETEYVLQPTVTTVAAYAFAGTKNLVTAVLPEGLTVLGEYGFCASGIDYITLPDSLAEIREYAFSSCTDLTNIHIPDNVLQIGRYAFAEDWNLYSVTFNETARLPRIGFAAFAYTGLQSFTVPASVSTIAQEAFVGSRSLSAITFAENSKLESISAYMFDGCENLQTITFLPGSKLTSIQAHGLEGMDKLSYVDFGDAKPENVDNFAFRFCESLTSLSLPDSVKSVGRYAFYGCKSLSDLALPEGVEHIGSYAFLGTNDLDLYMKAETMPAYLDENWDYGIRGYYTGVSAVETAGDFRYAVLGSGNLAILEYLGTEKTVDLTTVNLGAPITTIGGGAFKDSTAETVILPETLTTIQAEAFQYAALREIAIPASVTFIGREAFAYSELQSLTFEKGAAVSVIEQYAFRGTEKLTSVKLPASLTALGTGVFMESGLTSLTFAEGFALTEIPKNAFMGTKLVSVALPDSVVNVGHNAFRDILTLKSVTFGNNEGMKLQSNVFYNTGLESLHIPANVTYIGEYCFVGLENLTAITVDGNNPNFKAVDGLLLSKDGRKLVTVPAGRTGSLTVPISVEEIGFGAFENTALEEVLFDPNANILTFGYRAFFRAKNLTVIHVPASVVSIDYYAFAYCEKLHTVNFAKSNCLKGIYEGAFCGDINLENIVIPDAIVEISDFAFYGCAKITSLPLGESNAVKGIYDYAFAYTSIGGEFTAPETLIDIGAYAFLGTDITKLTIPDTNKKELIIGIGAFEDCNKLTEVTLPFIGASYEDEEISWFGYIFGAGAYEANETYVPESLKTVTITEGITFVGVGGFYKCSAIENATIPYSVSVLWDYAFGETTFRYELTNVITTPHGEIWNSTNGLGLSGHLTLSDDITAIGAYGFKDCSQLTEIVLSESITEISYGVFLNCFDLRTISWSSNVTYIDEHAFAYCKALESIVIPDGVLSVGSGAFTGCESLESIHIPDSVVSIGAAVFSSCSKLRSITIPESVTSFGTRMAFSHCFSLESIVLPDCVTVIEEYAFNECGYLQSVTIPKGVTEIEDYAFNACNNLQQIINHSNLELVFGSQENGGIAYSAKMMVNAQGTKSYANSNFLETADGFLFELSDGQYILHAYFGEEDTVTLPTSMEGNHYSLYQFTGAKHVIVPEGITTLGRHSFAHNSELESVVIPNSVTSIGYEAFYNCGNLRKVSLGNGVVTFGDSAFRWCEKLEDLSLPSSVAYIGGYAFDGCKKLKSVALPDRVTYLGFGSFANCSSLEKVTLSKNVTEIAGMAFNYCKSLESIIIPEGVTSIGAEAFGGCTALSEITIPSSVTSIETGALPGNAKLVFSGENPSFRMIDNILYTADMTEIVFASADIAGEVVLPNSVTDIRSMAFMNCANITSIVLPESVTTIGLQAFRGCSNLKRINIPEGISTIDYGAFADCQSLTSISIPDGADFDSRHAFDGCTSLKSVKLPSDMTVIGVGAFQNCSSLEEIEIPSGVRVIEGHTFAGCRSLKEIRIPDGVTLIEVCAFYECPGLTSLYIPDSVERIQAQAFLNCVNLRLVTIGSSVTEIEADAFGSCYNIIRLINRSSLELTPGGIEHGEVAHYAKILEDAHGNKTYAENHFETEEQFLFYISDGIYYLHAYLGEEETVTLPLTVNGCSYEIACCYGVKNAIIPDGMEVINDHAFYDCPTLESVTIPNSVKNISFSFVNCYNLSKVTLPDDLETIHPVAFDNCTGLYENAEYYNNGMLMINGWLIDIDGNTKYLSNIEGIRKSVEDVYAECYLLKDAVWMNTVLPSNIATLYITQINSDTACLQNHLTLKNVVIMDSVESIRNCQTLFTSENITGITIYVEALEQDLRWDDNFPGWSNGNKVVYGDEWSWVTFYDGEGNVISREPKLNSEIIRLPVYEPEGEEGFSYVVKGWDLDGDGIADHIPATTAVDLEVRPIVEKVQKLYTVTFGDLNGKVYHTATLPYGSLVVLPEAPEKKGHDFLGWSNYYEGMTVTGDVTIYASWKHHGDGHVYGEAVWVAPTCEEKGFYKHTCTVCDEYYGTDHVEALGHSDTSVTVQPTCTEEGYVLHTCGTCGREVRTDVTPAKGHAFGEWTADTPASCKKEGLKVRSCGECGLEETEVIPAAGHRYTAKVVKEPTCDQEGTALYTCEECGRQVRESIPKTAHKYEKKYVAKSWLRILIEKLLDLLFGYEGDRAYYFVCSECGRFRRVDEVQGNGTGVQSVSCAHVLSDWELYLPGEQGEDSVEARYCTVCKKPVEFRTAEPCAQHSGEWVVAKEATCSEDGLKQAVCVHCGVVLQEEVIPAAGHDWSDWTDGAPGREERTCRVCGEVESREKAVDYDVDGDGVVTEGDAQLLLSILVGNTESEVLFDFDFDGVLTIYDCVLLMQQIG